jgi:hypothetical protein
MSMHTFDPKIAEQVGIAPAVIYQNIVWWTQKNAANEKHFYDGRYWTYNSVKAFEVLFPYLTLNQIRRSLEKLESDGLILSGSFNKSAYDRTKWYSPADHIELANLPNEFGTDAEPIPVSKPVTKPDNKTISPNPPKSADLFDDFWAAVPRKIGKGHARKAWSAATKKAEPETIISAVKSFAAACAGHDQKYIPHPATWLNGERWADETAGPAKKYKYMQDTFGNLLRRRVGTQDQWTHYKDAGTWGDEDRV